MSPLLQEAVKNYRLDSRKKAAEILQRTIKRKFRKTTFCKPTDTIRLRIDGTTFSTELKNLKGVYRIPLNHVFIYDTTRYIESGLLQRLHSFIAAVEKHQKRITSIIEQEAKNASNDNSL